MNANTIMKYLSKTLAMGCLFMACVSQKEKKQVATIELIGSFRSTKGVMKPLSCYCYNGGYLTDKTGKETPICFPKDNDAEKCNQLTVVGQFKTVKNNSEDSSPCPSGEMIFLEVISFKCD